MTKNTITKHGYILTWDTSNAAISGRELIDGTLRLSAKEQLDQRIKFLKREGSTVRFETITVTPRTYTVGSGDNVHVL